MENKQDGRKTKTRPKGSATDLRQLDLWVATTADGGAQAVEVTATDSANLLQAFVSEPVSVSSPSVSVVGWAEPAEHELSATAQRNQNRSPPQGPIRSVLPSIQKNASHGSGALPALTRRQHELLLFLRERTARSLRPPSLSEICRELGLASRGSLHKQVVALVQAGLVEAMNGKQRGVRLIQAANDDDGGIPLLGVIAAGRPIEALIRDETIALPAWLKVPAACYALRVKGDSMRDAGILDGDVVVVEQRQHARNGETVVALIDGESATLKRIEQTPGEIVLHAENPDYPAQRYRPEQVAIQGVLVAALRRY